MKIRYWLESIHIFLKGKTLKSLFMIYRFLTTYGVNQVFFTTIEQNANFVILITQVIVNSHFLTKQRLCKTLFV